MLPMRSLDNERFSDIAQSAKEMIASLYPDWTDFNFHDPGITFIELFAWMKEMQQYHMDQVGTASQLKFLKILGADQRARRPASAHVHIFGAAENILLPEGTRLVAGDIPFETCQPEHITAGDLTGCYSETEEGWIDYGPQMSAEAGRLHCYPFGRAPRPGAQFYIGLDRPFVARVPLSIFFDVNDDYPVLRNPITDHAAFVPLSRIVWEYHSAGGWHPLDVHSDGTHAFICDGSLVFSLPDEMAPLPEEEGYWIRATLAESSYDIPPVLWSFNVNAVETRQQETFSIYRDFSLVGDSHRQLIDFPHRLAAEGLTEAYGLWADAWHRLEVPLRRTDDRSGTLFEVEVPDACLRGGRCVRLVCYEADFTLDRAVGRGDGFPYQNFALFSGGLLGKEFRLMIDFEGDGVFADWEQVGDFDASTEHDRHFVIDEDTGLIQFGNCEQGVAPEGEILVIACRRSFGRDGNVKAGRIDHFFDEDISASVVNPDNAFGGDDRESLEESFLRVRRELRQVERAVTYEDYEVLAQETPGLMIAGCKAIPASRMPRRDGSVDAACVSIVVQPYATSGVRDLSEAYIQNIQAHLAPRRLLGTRVSIISPEYIGIEIYGEIQVKSYYPDARARIEQAVSDYFGGGQWDFGRPVLYSTIYGIIDMLDCVSAIGSLAIDAQGKGIERSVGGDVLLPQNGMAYLKDASYSTTAVE